MLFIWQPCCVENKACDKRQGCNAHKCTIYLFYLFSYFYFIYFVESIILYLNSQNVSVRDINPVD